MKRSSVRLISSSLCFNLSFLTLFVVCAVVVFVFWSFLHFNSWTFCTPVGPDVTQNCTSRFLSEHAWYLKWWGDFHSFLPNHSHLSFCSCQLISSFLPSIHPSTVAWPQFFSSTLDVSLTMDLPSLGDTSSCDLLPVALITKSASPKNTWSASRQINPFSEQINSSNLLFAINITLLLTRLPEAFHLKWSQIVYRRTG